MREKGLLQKPSRNHMDIFTCRGVAYFNDRKRDAPNFTGWKENPCLSDCWTTEKLHYKMAICKNHSKSRGGGR